MQHPLHGRAGWHKSQIYNILLLAGQTLSTYKKTSPYRLGYAGDTIFLTDGNMPQSF